MVVLGGGAASYERGSPVGAAPAGLLLATGDETTYMALNTFAVTMAQAQATIWP